MTSTVQLNLTRKWRSKTFDEIVGQKLPVRLLKNSLYRNQLFPVYLLSGLRGSGKTSMGRIFATAVNCQKLADFRARPQEQKLPCLECRSCLAMREGNHPDFIEMDAASHTGVDNVRQIIEAASFLPVMGGKKIYLIDEAHMLSKAAFNAFLKILEEPPATALFLLATTDPQKIIETVKSRSFQLFFDPIHVDDLVPHLAYVCEQEKIAYEKDALALVAREGEGSARDALNLLERIRLAEGKISVEGVQRALGMLNDQQVIALFSYMGDGLLNELFEQLRAMEVERFSAELFWKKLVALVRALIWAHHGIAKGEFAVHYEQVKALSAQFSLALLVEFLDQLYRIELQFLKTTAQHALLESLLCKMTQRCATIASQAGGSSPDDRKKKQEPASSESAAQTNGVNIPKEVAKNQSSNESSALAQNWGLFLQEIGRHGNPIAASLFQNGTIISCERSTVRVRFTKKFAFYHDWIISNESLWKPLLEQAFGAGALLEPDFSGDSEQVASGANEEHKPVAESVIPNIQTMPRAQASGSFRQRFSSSRAKTARSALAKLDVSNKDSWSKAHMFLKFFSGTIHVVQE